jgi:peptidoglycan-N-acetylglucosamine deacetylase
MSNSKSFEWTAKAAVAGRRIGRTLVTSSWDDGHILDHRVANLLDTYGVRGTFYVAPRNVEIRNRDRLGGRDLRALAGDFEIGGHTLTHLRLTTIPDPVADREIKEGKDRLEEIIDSPIHSFCYPGGAYDKRHLTMVQSAGFSYARTVRRWVTGASANPMEVHTTVNAYRHLVDWPAALRVSRGSVSLANRYFWNWDLLAMALFDQVLSTGGVYHLWGHSWEIDYNHDWDRLERVLGYIGGHPGVRYVNNVDTITPINAPCKGVVVDPR